MRRAALALVVVALVGCGGDDRAEPAAGAVERSDRLVDFSEKPPYVNALDIDPSDGAFLLTTNKGFWRIEDGVVSQIRGSVTAEGKTGTVGTFLELAAIGPRALVGSGHPDVQGALPAFLGFMRSADGGATWRVLSRLGDADLHKIVARHERLYAFDAVLGAMLISADGGRTWEEHFTPRGLIIDFEVDPADPAHLVASNESELFASADSGEAWRPLERAEGVRLSWPAPDALFRAVKDGTVSVSADGGRSWTRVGSVPGEPYKFKAVDAKHLYLALSDGTIMETQDGGKAWTAAFRP